MVTGNTHSHSNSIAPFFSKRTLINKIIFRAVILIIIISAIAISTAAHRQPATSKTSANLSNNEVEVQYTKDNAQAALPESSATITNNSTSTSAGTSVNTSTDSNGQMQVTINGQDVAVPQNSSTHKVLTTPSSTTVVNVSNDTSGNNADSTRQHTSIQSSTTSRNTQRTNVTERQYGTP